MPAGDTLDIELAVGGIKASNDQVTEILLGIRQLSRIKNIGFRVKIPH
jgi:hypothetical protein